MLRALVVEDNLSEANRIRTVCEKAGFEVSVAASISEAENLLSAHRYTLAILDLSLSDRSSSSLFDEITEKSLVSNVMILTGNPSSHLKERFLSQGAIGYILKGSADASSESLFDRVTRIASNSSTSTYGLDLQEFIQRCIPPEKRELFWPAGSRCSECDGDTFVVSFSEAQQFPSEVVGGVQCASCGHPFDDSLN